MNCYFLRGIVSFIMVISLGGSLVFATNSANSSLLNSLISDIQTADKDITQAEFLTLMGRLLVNTNDLAPNQFISPLSDVPKWAEVSVNHVQNKFGSLTPYYFESFNPKSSISKDTIVKFLIAYLDTSKQNLRINQSIEVAVEGYDPESAYKQLIEYGVLPNTLRTTLTKLEVGNALIKASQYRHESLASASNNLNREGDYRYLGDVRVEKDSLLSQSLFNSDYQAFINGNIGISNLYSWRGMSQTKNIGNPAIFGGFDTSFLDRFSLGTWLSTVSFSDQTSYALDVYGSFRDTMITFPGLSYEVGIIYYAYPNITSRDSIDFSEGFAGLNYQNFTFQYHMLLTGPNSASVGDDNYISLKFTRNVIQEIKFIGNLGYYRGNVNLAGSQIDYLFGLQTKGFTFATIGTNQDDQKPSILIKYEQRIF